ncbi:MAG: response regulator [Pseudomonadota bacterium]
MNSETKRKILVIDDAVTVRMYHKQAIESLGFSVEEADNGIEALEKALQNSYDLFLVDVNMPKMDGYALVKEMRKNEELSAVPVIMISTEAELQDKDKAYEVGANYYIVKPAKEGTLQKIVGLLMGD